MVLFPHHQTSILCTQVQRIGNVLSSNAQVPVSQRNSFWLPGGTGSHQDDSHVFCAGPAELRGSFPTRRVSDQFEMIPIILQLDCRQIQLPCHLMRRHRPILRDEQMSDPKQLKVGTILFRPILSTQRNSNRGDAPCQQSDCQIATVG